MTMSFTPEQEQAIGTRGNLIVSAAAGAGKTAVLTERVFRLIRDGMPVSRMLILTFTRAAAAEMKARIQKRLLQEAEDETEPERRAYFRRQSNDIQSANISTIHAFCSRVVFRHFHLVGLSPSARTMDETEAAVLIDEVLDRVLTMLATEQRDDFHALLTAFESEGQVRDAMLRLYRFLQAQPAPETWLDDAAAAAGDEAAFRRVLAQSLQEDKRELASRIRAVERARDTLPPACATAIAVLDNELLSARGALLQEELWTYAEALSAMLPFARISFPRDFSAADKAPVQQARDGLKKLVKAQADSLTGGYADWYALQQLSAGIVAALARAERAFLQAFAEEKRQKNMLDFNDLEHFCDRILGDAEIAAEYRDTFDTIIVDEYQDSNRVQEQILSHIRRADNLFFVGDVKQSIYRFRAAEPSLFLEKLASFTGKAGTRVDLSKNFRSSRAVIDAVNRVFSVLMNGEAGDLVYDDRSALVQGCPQPDGDVSLHVIDRDSADIEDGMTDAVAEARFCGGMIADLMERARMTDTRDGSVRAYRYDDFVILLRNTSHARAWAQTLALMGIPCFAQLGGGYFDAIEVMLVLNLLRVIDNRRQDIPLLSVMRSEFGGFADEELIAMRQRLRQGSLLDCLLASSQGENAAHPQAFLDLLSRYRNKSRILSTEDLIALILGESGFYEAVGAITGGAQRQANLDALLEKAHVFDQTGACGVHAFLAFMDKAEKTAGMGAAQLPVKNVVRIMSIHKSKGLEFPVVFLGNLGGQFNTDDQKQRMLLHREIGIGLQFTSADRIRCNTFSRRAIAARIAREQRQEELRVLYVAMTRARQRLYLVGCRAKAEQTLSQLAAPDASGATTASTFLQWLLPVLNGYVPVTLHHKNEFVSESAISPVPDLVQREDEMLDALTRHLEWTYPHRDTLGLPDKASVTGLVPAPDLAFHTPAFWDGQQTAAARGAAVHRLLERLPLSGAPSEAFYHDASEREKGYIDWFVRTPLFERMRRSPRVERELSFSYPADTQWLLGVPSHERVLLQGVIDACFLEDGQWVLLDYKTDQIGDAEPRAYARKHLRQLTLYRDVLARITGIPVKAAYLVLLRANAAVEL